VPEIVADRSLVAAGVAAGGASEAERGEKKTAVMEWCLACVWRGDDTVMWIGSDGSTMGANIAFEGSDSRKADDDLDNDGDDGDGDDEEEFEEMEGRTRDLRAFIFSST
jgi:hypothetical protein